MSHSTLQDIAKATGYSISTVSRALSGFSRISSATRQKILKYAHQIGHLETSCREIAIIMPKISIFTIYWGPLINCICNELFRLGFTPVLFYDHDLTLLEKIQFAGAISVMSLNGFEKYWGKKQIMPLICINTASQNLNNIFSVYSDDRQGMTTAVEYLLQNGHQRIGRLGYTNPFFKDKNWNNSHRNQTFTELMEKNHLPADLYSIINCQGITEALKHLLDQNITALILPIEGKITNVLHALKILNIRVPEDLSLIAWSNDENAGSLDPPVTNIEQNYPELARTSCELLCRLMNQEKIEGDVYIPYLFKERYSVANINGRN